MSVRLSSTSTVQNFVLYKKKPDSSTLQLQSPITFYISFATLMLFFDGMKYGIKGYLKYTVTLEKAICLQLLKPFISRLLSDTCSVNMKVILNRSLKSSSVLVCTLKFDKGFIALFNVVCMKPRD